jgi:predicted negative regulator of RcsB-dependent stress response
MKNWFKKRTPHEKLLLALIVILLVGIVVRWTWVKKEAGDAFRHRLEYFSNPDSL